MRTPSNKNKLKNSSLKSLQKDGKNEMDLLKM